MDPNHARYQLRYAPISSTIIIGLEIFVKTYFSDKNGGTCAYTGGQEGSAL